MYMTFHTKHYEGECDAVALVYIDKCIFEGTAAELVKTTISFDYSGVPYKILGTTLAEKAEWVEEIGGYIYDNYILYILA